MVVTLFNRKELFVTWEIERWTEICNLLDGSEIEYFVKAVNSQTTNFFGSSRRAKCGSFGINPHYTFQYKIYVKKEDFEKAKYVIGDTR